MTEMGAEESAKWKQKYLSLVNRTELQERRYKEEVTVLKGGLIKLCQVAQSGDQDFDQRLSQLNNSLQDSFRICELQQQIDSIPNDGSAGTVASGGNTAKFAPYEINSFVSDIVSHINVPENFKDDLTALNDLLKDDLPSEKLEEALNLANLIVLETFTRDQKKFEDFLGKVNKELAAFHAFFAKNDGRAQSSQASGERMDEIMQREVKGIQENMSADASIESLTAAVNGSLGSLVNNFDKFRSEEKERNEKAAEENESLKKLLEETEKQANTLRGDLQEQQQRAHQDSLTKLPNRGAYNEKIAELFDKWQQEGGDIVMVVTDIDNFKKFNDTYGHIGGDKVLYQVAKQMRAGIPEDQFAARYGGEEFVILYYGLAMDKAFEITDKIREKIAGCPFRFKDEQVQITVSFGISAFKEGDTVEAVFERADAALYTAKKNGKNQVVKG